MPGLGFYKGYGSGEALIPVADALCFEYFIKPTLLARAGDPKHGGVLVHNIGTMTARDVAYRFRAGDVVQEGVIDALAADRVIQVFPDASVFGEGAKVGFRIEASESYSDVSDEVEVHARVPEEAEES